MHLVTQEINVVKRRGFWEYGLPGTRIVRQEGASSMGKNEISCPIKMKNLEIVKYKVRTDSLRLVDKVWCAMLPWLWVSRNH